MKYTDLSEVQQQELLKQANIATRVAKKNIEKDWWGRVCRSSRTHVLGEGHVATRRVCKAFG
jgi:hypothetical protein